MKNLRFKKVSAAFALITGFLMMTVLVSKSAVIPSPDYLTGKVQYSDDHSPVSEGNIKIMSFDNFTNSYKVLETISLNENGTFKINRNLILTTDEIRIMAYPNDVDNNEIPFQAKEIGIQNYEVTENQDYEILIEVERHANIKNGSMGKLIYNGNDFNDESANLKQNYPNPFNPSTMIRFELPESKNVSLIVYNIKGETVAVLAENEPLQKGHNEFEFNAGNLPSGVYLYSLTAGNFTQNKKMTLLK